MRALAEEFRFSDPVSSEETRRLEEQLEICLKRLEEALQTGGAVTDVFVIKPMLYLSKEIASA